MKNKNTETHGVYVREVIDPMPARHGISAFLANFPARTMIDDAIYTASGKRCRALIIKSAMEAAGALAMAVGHLSQMAPLGNGVYQDLLRAYGEKAVQRILMMQFMILLILSIVLAALVIFLIVCYSDYRHLKKENNDYDRLFKDQFRFHSDSPETYEAMRREAGRYRKSDEEPEE